MQWAYRRPVAWSLLVFAIFALEGVIMVVWTQRTWHGHLWRDVRDAAFLCTGIYIGQMLVFHVRRYHRLRDAELRQRLLTGPPSPMRRTPLSK
jgi:hypothetical protein